jgi:hypothetical protein
MEMRQWLAVGATAALLTAVGPPGEAAAATPEVSGRSSTVMEWYSTANDKTVTPFYQYLMLNAKNLDGDGLNFKGYGRVAEDFSSEVDVDSRLYYAYLEKNNLTSNLDLRLGRQFVTTTAGASVMDGLYLRLKDLGGLKLSVFGGGDVAYYEGYSAKDFLVGTEIRGKVGKDLNLGLSYLQKWQEGDITHELIGLDGDYEFRELLNLYSELQYSYLAKSVTYFTGGANYHRSSDWSLRAEYLYSLPVFSSTSIYSVFAVDRYEEVMGELRYRLDPGLYGFLRYQNEMYEETANATVVEAGLEKIRTGNFSGYVSGVLRNDKNGQDLKGVKVHGAYMFTKALQCGLGADINVFERRLDENDDETTSTRYWADVSYDFTRKLGLQVKAEKVSSQLWDDYYRGRVRLNVSF